MKHLVIIGSIGLVLALASTAASAREMAGCDQYGKKVYDIDTEEGQKLFMKCIVDRLGPIDDHKTGHIKRLDDSIDRTNGALRQAVQQFEAAQKALNENKSDKDVLGHVVKGLTLLKGILN